jgi:hypothetical protein
MNQHATSSAASQYARAMPGTALPANDLYSDRAQSVRLARSAEFVGNKAKGIAT